MATTTKPLPKRKRPPRTSTARKSGFFDKYGHWKVCDGCTEKFAEASHDSSEDCEICGYVYYTDGLAYELNADETSYTLTGIGEATDKNVKIPEEYKGLPVTAIKLRAFSQCTSIISIVIPDSVTEIGSQAFYECSNLQSVKLPANLTQINTYLFFGCSALKSVTVPATVTEIGEKAFADCPDLQTVNYGGSSAQWALITKPSAWKHNSNAFTVKCADGTEIPADEA